MISAYQKLLGKCTKVLGLRRPPSFWGGKFQMIPSFLAGRQGGGQGFSECSIVSFCNWYVFSHKERAWWGWQGGAMMLVICASRNRCWRRENGPGWSSRPGNPFHRLEIHPQAGQPHGFIAGGEGGVCSYWILTGNTEEGTPERPMHSYRPHKTQECSPSASQLLKTNIFSKNAACSVIFITYQKSV